MHLVFFTEPATTVCWLMHQLHQSISALSGIIHHFRNKLLWQRWFLRFDLLFGPFIITQVILKKRPAITGQTIWMHMCVLLTCISTTNIYFKFTQSIQLIANERNISLRLKPFFFRLVVTLTQHMTTTIQIPIALGYRSEDTGPFPSLTWINFFQFLFHPHLKFHFPNLAEKRC